MLKMNAQILETHPGAEIFFLGRDAEYHFDLAVGMSDSTTDGAGRLHLTNLFREVYQNPKQRELKKNTSARKG